MAGDNSNSNGPSTLRNLIPLIIILLVASAIAYICYEVYLSAQQVRQSAKERMGRKNVVFSRDGVKVGVKSYRDEKYVDKTQSWVVKAWNLATPAAPAAEEQGNAKKKQ